MPEPTNSQPTVPEQPESRAPLRRSLPVVIPLIVIVALIGLANMTSLLSGNRKNAPASALTMSPTTPNAQQVSSFEKQQQMQARHDADERKRQQTIAAAMQQLQQAEDVPSPEASAAPPMTAAQRAAIYGESPNAPSKTSNQTEAQAEAKQKRLAIEKQRQDALNSDTVAIDFAREGSVAGRGIAGITGEDRRDATDVEQTTEKPASLKGSSSGPEKANAMAAYPFDEYQGRLYRVFEGTVLEGVVTNRVDGGFSGPVLVMLTTDYYSHDHQQLLMPQGTRLIGTVQSVGNAQQRRMFVTFHRAVCPDGFSLDFDKYLGLDQVGTTGLASKVDHGYLMAFGAVAAIGGLGGLAQIGNNGTVLQPSTQIRNGISEQTAAEGEQVLNHFLNRLPIITLKEGSRARVYIGRDLLVPSYAEHRVDPAL